MLKRYGGDNSNLKLAEVNILECFAIISLVCNNITVLVFKWCFFSDHRMVLF